MIYIYHIYINIAFELIISTLGFYSGHKLMLLRTLCARVKENGPSLISVWHLLISTATLRAMKIFQYGHSCARYPD